jgi:NAD(P)-dependent dehydrogenase (short-subunit alcohol dehydrogenase family)
MELRNKVVVITGGGRGIGRALAVGCAEMGATVVVAARSLNELSETATAIEKGRQGKCVPMRCDVALPDDVRQLFTFTEKEVGPVFGLICAAGIYGPIGSFEETNFEQWQRTIEINLVGTARCVHFALQSMKPRRKGSIILFSGGGQGPMPNFSGYVTSKGGIWRLTETLGRELLSHNIAVNAVAPGAVNTRLLEDLLEAGPEKAGEAVYRKALEQKQTGGAPPEKAVKLVQYLLSEKSRGLSGKILSALWDPFETLDPIQVTESDLYTMRRVTSPDGGTRA